MDEDGARSWDVEPVDEVAEPVLVDELLDGVARRQAGREALLELRREPGHGQRPLVAAAEQDRPFQAQRAEQLGERVGVG